MRQGYGGGVASREALVNQMPLDLLIDWIYATCVEPMDQKQRQEFDGQLDAIMYVTEHAEESKRQRREIARINALKEQKKN